MNYLRLIIFITLVNNLQSFSQDVILKIYAEPEYTVFYTDKINYNGKFIKPKKKGYQEIEICLTKPSLIFLVFETDILPILCFPNDTIFISDPYAKEIKSTQGEVFDVSNLWLSQNDIKLTGINWSIFPNYNDEDNILKYSRLLNSFRDCTSSYHTKFSDQLYKELKYYLIQSLLQNYNEVGIHKGKFAKLSVVNDSILTFYSSLKFDFDRDTEDCMNSITSFSSVLLNDFLSKYLAKNESNIQKSFKYAFNWENTTYRNAMLFNYMRYMINLMYKLDISKESILNMNASFQETCTDENLKKLISLMILEI